ncbi:MAG: Ig-like domain-containing protein [Clostridia bacterium]
MVKRKLGFKAIISFVIICIITSTINFQQIKATISSNLPVSYMDENFPDSYMPYINAMKQKHPNWIFKAVHTGLDWNTVLSHESYEVNDGISLVEDIFAAEWKRDGQNYYKDGSYVTASKQGVAYVVDPRNFINDSGIFQFETLSFSSASQNVNAVQGVLEPTPMGSSYKSQYKYYGEWKDLGTTYAELIFNLSKEVGINPVHIASRIRQENSGNIINGSLINGDYGVYNFFNIGAYDTANASAITNGLNYARNQGWTSVSAAIKGGIEYIYNKYVKWGQDTIYFERFDVNNPGTAQWLLGTGYMTNIFGAKNEASMSYNTYESYGMLDCAFEFHIPVYENMPEEAASMPLPSDVYFTQDNTRVYLDDPSDSGVTDEFWIRTGPDTIASILEKVYETKDGAQNRTKFTRIGIGQNTLYDKIQYDDGRVGYILKKWIYEYSYTKVDSVSLNTTYSDLNVGDTLQLVATINPNNAENKNVSWSTSDENIATVDQNGNVKAINDGVATIKVTTQDQSKTAICTVNVVSNRVTGITLNKDCYILNIEDTLAIIPKITPSTAKNTNYTITSSNNDVASVSNNIIYAKSEGEAIITFKTEDGGYTAQAKVIVTTQKKDIYLDSSLRLENNIITKIDLSSNTVANIKNKITTEYQTTVTNIDGKELTDEDKIGTGTIIQFKENGNVVEEYTFLIYGDVDGSGTINARDLLMLQRYLLGKAQIKDIQIKAAITDKVSQAPKAADLLKIQRHILGKYTIEQ